MKTIIWNFIKIFFAIAVAESIFFILMISFVMSDESIGLIGKSLVIVVQYILGFLLVLLNTEYPFFINRNKIPNDMILLVVLNLIIQTGIVFFIKYLIKRMKS